MHATTSGLVNGVWFSHTPVTQYEAVEVYGVVHNQTDTTMEGIATLLVDDVAVGAQELHVRSGAIEKVAIPHHFTEGSHSVRISFTAGNGFEVTLTQLPLKTVYVVRDTDGDGIQDSTDPDDDNDGIRDEDDDEPLVKNVVPKSESSFSLSDSGKKLLDSITRNATSSETIETAPEASEVRASTTESQIATLLSAIDRLENLRKESAVAVRSYEEAQRMELEGILEEESSSVETEGFEPTVSHQSDKREHQMAAAGASVLGTVLESIWMFYAHIVILVLSVVHLAWSWFKSLFGRVKDDYEEEEE